MLSFHNISLTCCTAFTPAAGELEQRYRERKEQRQTLTLVTHTASSEQLKLHCAMKRMYLMMEAGEEEEGNTDCIAVTHAGFMSKRVHCW